MTTAEILLKIAQRLGILRHGTASTSGTTTTLVNSGALEPTGYYDGGTIWFISGDLAGKTAVITTWVLGSTYTFTYPTQSAATASGNRYAVATKEYRRDMLVNALNVALAEVGPFDNFDQTLTTVLDQEIYTLPAGVDNVKRVEIATSATSPYKWEAVHRNWHEENGYLYLSDSHLPGTAGLPIRLTWTGGHTNVNADTDEISEDVNEDLLAALAALNAAQERAMIVGTSDKSPLTRLQMLAPQVASLRARFPVRRATKTVRYANVPNDSREW